MLWAWIGDERKSLYLLLSFAVNLNCSYKIKLFWVFFVFFN